METKGLKLDVDGKESSKRTTGIKLVNVSIVWALIDYSLRVVLGLFDKEIGFEFPLEIWMMLLGTGCGLLGVTLVERFSKK